MNTMSTRKTAILVDGGYYRKRCIELWGSDKKASDRADELFNYCMLHLSEPKEPRDLYRIFYYDCPPMTREIVHPLTGETISFANMAGTRWTNGFFEALAKKPKLAIRRGELAESQASYVLKQEVLSNLLQGKKDLSSLTKSDFRLDVKQKGVDMRIGLDVAALAYGRYVDQIILIAGDSDFIPVAKMARRSGIEFILDPMKQYIRPKLAEHLDGIEIFTDKMYQTEDAESSETEPTGEPETDMQKAAPEGAADVQQT